MHAPSGAQERLRVEEVLTETGDDAFLLTGRLSKPTTRLPFTRPGDGDRRRTLRVLEPAGGRIEGEPAMEAIVSDVPFEHVVLRVPVHEHDPEKDYRPFIRLEGGGVLVYSGQLDLGAQETSEIRFRFVARPPHFVVVPGQRTGIEAERAPSKDGTYAAFTTTAPIEESAFVAIIDPGLPGALQQTVRASFPALLRHYRDALGERPQGKPTLLLSFGRADSPTALSIKGGVVGGALQLHVRLGSRRIDPRDAQVRADLRLSLAHETAHLWNTEVARPRGPDWVHEGGADLLAWTALRAIGELSTDGYLERLSWATSVCVLLRGRERLDDDPAQARYACGAVIELIASNGDAPGAERVWNRLLGSTRGSGLYDVAALFAAARQARAPEQAVEAAESLEQAGAVDGVARMAQGLALAGYSLTARADAPARFRQVALEAGKPGARWLAVRPAAAR